MKRGVEWLKEPDFFLRPVNIDTQVRLIKKKGNMRDKKECHFESCRFLKKKKTSKVLWITVKI